MSRLCRFVWILALLGTALAHSSGPPPACWPSSPGTDPRLCPPRDPLYPRHWDYLSSFPEGLDLERLHPAERALGASGFSLDRAWQRTIGRPDVVIAVLDSGIRWGAADLVDKLWVNVGELPPPFGAAVHDANGDGIVTARDWSDDPRVGDRNGNGRLDPQDLIRAFSDGKDGDGNGWVDDICGWDFFHDNAGDNDPHDETDFGHGTGIASTAAAITNNNDGDVGVCPRCRVLPVRVGDSFVVDANRFARGLVFAARSGAAVVASALGSYNNTPAARAAVRFAYEHGTVLAASAADEFSYHHNYPSLYPEAIYVNAIRYNRLNDPEKASGYWGLSPCTNFGARVSLSVPAGSCSSGATARLAGAVGLIVSAARDAGIADLHPGESFQLLRSTTDDLDDSSPNWGATRFPARAGFDTTTGYGRLNVDRAVAAAAAGRIPPRVDLDAPDWFSIVSPAQTRTVPVDLRIALARAVRATWTIEYALGVEPGTADWIPVGSGEIVAPGGTATTVLDFSKVPRPRWDPPRRREERDRYSVTLRGIVIDDRGQTAEARRSFFVFDDPGWVSGFPVDLGSSGEAGPTLADLDGDGRAEIVVPTADGLLRLYDWDGGRIVERRIALDPIAPLDSAKRPSLTTEPLRETVIRRAAVGDLEADGRVEIVVASREGRVHVFDSAGGRRRGFPVRTDPTLGGPASKDQVIESGILSAPLLANLDGRPGDEIVVTGLDGNLWVWRGDGSLLPGFPVAIEDRRSGSPRRAKSVSTPAVGDLDGDGRPEIVFGSNHLTANRGAAWAVRSDGSLHPGGAFVPGFAPLELAALRPDLLPTLATGVAMEPALLDLDGDGDLEVALHAVTGSEVVIADSEGSERIVARMSMVPSAESEFRGITFLTGTGSPLAVDTDHDGRAELYTPLLPFRMLTLRTKPGVPLDVPLSLGGWNLVPPEQGESRLAMRAGFPVRMEDLMVFAKPAAADVDSDGKLEILMGSGGYLLHAFRTDGTEAKGFPKFTGGWIFSAPAVGDVDGDGRLDVVVVTREGALLAWSSGPLPGTVPVADP